MTQIWRWTYGPGYRSIVAQMQAKHGTVEGHGDSWIRAATAHYREQQRVGAKSSPSHKANLVAQALQVQSCPDLLNSLILLVLGDMPRLRMVEQVRLDEPLIEMWERLFFACREYLSTRGLIRNTVIHGQQQCGDLDFAAKMHMAFTGGQTVAEELVASGTELSPECQQKLNRIKTRMMAQSLSGMSITPSRATAEAMRLSFRMLQEDLRVKSPLTNRLPRA